MALLINVDPARKRAGFKVGAGSVAHDEDEEDEDPVSTME
jgi:hypothetical protein